MRIKSLAVKMYHLIHFSPKPILSNIVTRKSYWKFHLLSPLVLPPASTILNQFWHSHLVRKLYQLYHNCQSCLENFFWTRGFHELSSLLSSLPYVSQIVAFLSQTILDNWGNFFLKDAYLPICPTKIWFWGHYWLQIRSNAWLLPSSSNWLG